MINPDILCYILLEFDHNKDRKTPRYNCAMFAGFYPPLLKLINNIKGELYFYLVRSRKKSDSVPEYYLQGKGSINFSGLFHYRVDGKMSGFCSGYPCSKKILGGTKPFENPFYENRDDGFLFIIHCDEKEQSPIPVKIEVIVLKDARALIDAYRKQLVLGGFDDELNRLRAQAKPWKLNEV